MKRLKLFSLLAASGSAIALLVLPATLSAADGKPTREAVPDADNIARDIDDAITELLEGTPKPTGQRRVTPPR